MTTPLVHIRNAKSFGPAAAQRLVELHQRQMLVEHGVAQADLGVEIAPLGVQHVDVIGASGTVLQVRQFDLHLPPHRRPGTVVGFARANERQQTNQV